jgi:predicted esterase
MKFAGDSKRVFIGGFSIGCTIALSVYLSMRPEEVLGGVFCYSGIFAADPDWSKIDISVKKQTPIRIYHLECDEYAVFTKGYAKASFERLKAKGLDHFKMEIRDNHIHTLDHCCEALEKFCKVFEKDS